MPSSSADFHLTAAPSDLSLVEVLTSPEAATFDPRRHRRYWTTDLVTEDRLGTVRRIRYCVRLQRICLEGQDPFLIGSSRDGQSSYQELVERRERDEDGREAVQQVYQVVPGTEGWPHPHRGHVIAIILPRKVNGRWESEAVMQGQIGVAEEPNSDP